jgi:hypothetical protein
MNGMRFVRGLLLALFLLPAGALIAPCCAEAIEACCPLDRACEEGEACPGTTTPLVAVATELPDSATLPSKAPVLMTLSTVCPLPRALERSASPPPRVPLRN